MKGSQVVAKVRLSDYQRRAHREQFVESVLGMVAVLPFDLVVARTHAAVWADLAGAGRMIGAHDLMIAATALAHGLLVATRNEAKFRGIERLELLTGW